MYNTTTVVTALKNILGWEDHYDPAVVPNLPSSLTNSETKQFYNGFSPALDLEYIKSSIRPDDTITNYLLRIEDSVISQMLNNIIVSKQLKQYFKSLLRQSVIHSGSGYYKDMLVNEGRFVGISTRVHENKGLKVMIQKIGLQASLAQTNLDIYIFHSSQKAPLQTIQFNSTNADSFEWDVFDLELKYDNGTDVIGGVYYIGYYQDDLSGQAVQFKKLNWNSGYCASCDGGVSSNAYKSFAAYVDMMPFYVASADFTKGELFDPADVILTPDNNWGLNFSFTIECDLTEFWVDNRTEFVNLQGLMMASRVMNDILYSQNVNFIEEQMKQLIVMDLKGDKATKAMSMEDRIKNAMNAINFDHGSLSSACLPCTEKPRTHYGTV